MKRPPVGAVLIGPYKYTVQYDAHMQLQGNVVGLCGPDEEKLLLDPLLGPMKERETLLHEVRHGVWHYLALSDDFSDKQEEKVIRRETPALLEVLRRNPRLAKYLLGQP